MRTPELKSCLVLLMLVCLAPLQAQSTTAKVVQAANKFLASLTGEQRQKVIYAWNDDQQRARWSNFPTGFVPRGGIDLKQMNSEQRAAVMELLATVLSPMGLEKVNQIRMADDDFKANGSKRGPPGGGPGRGNGGPPPPNGPPPGPPPGRFGPGGSGPGRGFPAGDMFGSDLYYISFLGKPSTTVPWMLQFGGHHLALNITIAGTKGVMTPSLTGAQPATFAVNGRTIRPLGRESDKALALLDSLNDSERREAILDYRVADLVLGPGEDGKKIAPEGLKASDMNDRQRAMLMDLMAEWAGIMNHDAASERMAELKADLNDTWFAWSGPVKFEPGTNITAYYRIQGPHVVIEYAPQHDEPTNHVHTIYRDPTNDYGRQFSQP